MNQHTMKNIQEKAQALFNEAYRCQQEKDFERAIRLYQASIVVYPTAKAHTHLSTMLHKQGQIEEAIKECKRAICIDPDIGEPYYILGMCLHKQGFFLDAIEWLQKAQQAKKYYEKHLCSLELGKIFLGLQTPNLALEEFKQVQKVDPSHSEAKEGILQARSMMN